MQGLDELRIVLDPIGQTGLAIALMLVIFSVALGLRVSDFALLKTGAGLGQQRRQALTYVGGVLTQIVGLPLLTFLIVSVVELPASVALGMIVVACCPGGAVSNLLTFLARGNVAYSVALTATSSVLAAIITPASILFWSHLYPPTAEIIETLDISPWLFLGQTMLLLGVPLIAGMLLAARVPDVAERLRKRTALLGSMTLAGVVVYGIVYFFPVFAWALPMLLAVAVMHNALAFLLGAGVGYAMRANGPIRRALTMEVGIQNSGLAIVILIAQLEGVGGAAAMAAVWGVWHLIGGSLIVVGLRAIDRR